jgi:hypothetical protein
LIKIAEGELTADEAIEDLNAREARREKDRWGNRKQEYLKYCRNSPYAKTEYSVKSDDEIISEFEKREGGEPKPRTFNFMRDCFIPPYYGLRREPEIILSWLREKITSSIPRSSSELEMLKILSRHKTILIDTEAYNSRRLAKLDRHISELQELWRDVSNIGFRSINWVIFFQKELFDKYKDAGHEDFFVKKFQVIVMERIKAEDLVNYVKLTFKTPFSDEALFELAMLSYGIWRRFKWLISESLFKARQEDKLEISAEDVKRWVNADYLTEDLRAELIDVFPKGDIRRDAAAKILVFLGNGEKSQPDIREHANISAKECSIVLKKLKEKGYITSRRGQLCKLWKLNEGG